MKLSHSNSQTNSKLKHGEPWRRHPEFQDPHKQVQGNTNMEKKKESKRRKEMREEESETSKEKEKS